MASQPTVLVKSLANSEATFSNIRCSDSWFSKAARQTFLPEETGERLRPNNVPRFGEDSTGRRMSVLHNYLDYDSKNHNSSNCFLKVSQKKFFLFLLRSQIFCKILRVCSIHFLSPMVLKCPFLVLFAHFYKFFDKNYSKCIIFDRFSIPGNGIFFLS